jgi:hypothetical protein
VRHTQLLEAAIVARELTGVNSGRENAEAIVESLVNGAEIQKIVASA